MKPRSNFNRLMRRLSIRALLLLCAYSVSASPITLMTGVESNGLDLIYLILGFSAICILVFYPIKEEAHKELNREEIKIQSEFENRHYRKVIRKTA